jgi:hypothetical protein
MIIVVDVVTNTEIVINAFNTTCSNIHNTTPIQLDGTITKNSNYYTFYARGHLRCGHKMILCFTCLPKIPNTPVKIISGSVTVGPYEENNITFRCVFSILTIYGVYSIILKYIVENLSKNIIALCSYGYFKYYNRNTKING